MQTYGLGNGVDDGGISDRGGDDVGQVDSDKVDFIQSAFVCICATYLDQDHENDTQKQEEGCQEGPDEAGACGPLDLRLGRFGECSFRLHGSHASVSVGIEVESAWLCLWFSRAAKHCAGDGLGTMIHQGSTFPSHCLKRAKRRRAREMAEAEAETETETGERRGKGGGGRGGSGTGCDCTVL